jgi:uncharacterized protein YukE
MAILHMDVESVQATRGKMVSEKEIILDHLTSLSGQVNQTVGSAWIGSAATEFQQGYEALRSQLTQQLGVLGQLADALNVEITQWQEMAARLG